MIKLLHAFLYPLLLIDVVFAVDGPYPCLITVLLLLELPLLLALLDLAEEVLLTGLIAVLDTLQTLFLFFPLSHFPLHFPFPNLHFFFLCLVVHLLDNCISHTVHK